MVQKTITGIETLAGLFLAFVAALTFASVILRYLFSFPVPDSFDIGRLMIGVVVFWGIAVAGYRDEHIRMDVLWTLVGPRGQRLIDIFATACSLLAMAVFARMLVRKIVVTYETTSQTFDLRLDIWPFYALAWIGIVAATILLALRLWRLLCPRVDAIGAGTPPG